MDHCESSRTTDGKINLIFKQFHKLKIQHGVLLFRLNEDYLSGNHEKAYIKIMYHICKMENTDITNFRIKFTINHLNSDLNICM